MKGKRRARLAAGVAFLAAGGFLLAAAQGNTRVVQGQVLDENEEPVEGAVVHLQNRKTEKEISVITDKEGRYKFNSVDKKTNYRIHAVFKNMRSRTRSISELDTRDVVFIHLRLKPGKEPDSEDPARRKESDQTVRTQRDSPTPGRLPVRRGG